MSDFNELVPEDWNPYSIDPEFANARLAELRQACQLGSLDAVRFFLQRDLTTIRTSTTAIPMPMRFLQKSLFAAFAKGHLDIVQYLLRECHVRMERLLPHLATCAAWSCMPVEAWQLLLDEGWTVNTPLHGSDMALRCVAKRMPEILPPVGGALLTLQPTSSHVLKSLPVTTWFLENGADPNLGREPRAYFSSAGPMCSHSGHTLNMAVYADDPDTAVAVIDLLVKYGMKLENSVALHFAAEMGPSTREITEDGREIFRTSASRIPVLKRLLEIGYDANGTDGRLLGPYALGSPIFYAISKGHIENVEILLQNGADPYVENRSGLNALQAAEQRFKEIKVPGSRSRILAREIIDLVRKAMERTVRPGGVADF